MEWDETTHLFLPDDALAVDPEEEPQYMAKMVPAYLNVKSFSKSHEKLYKKIGIIIIHSFLNIILLNFF